MQGRAKSEQAQPLGAPMVDELLQDSFLKRISGQFFQMLHEERAHVAPELAQQARAAGALVVRWWAAAERWSRLLGVAAVDHAALTMLHCS